MKVLLVYANSFMDNLIPVGVSLLSACLKKAGHETKLFDTTFYRTRGKTGDQHRVETLQIKETRLEEYGVHEKKTDMADDFKKMIDEFKPGLIVVSVVETTYFIALELLNEIKDIKIPKVVGGIHATMAPEDVIKEESVDIVCVGEGEIALVELANRIEKGLDYYDVLNLWVKKRGEVIRNPVGPLVNLDDLPDQDWSIYEKERFYKPMGGKVWICGAIEYDRGCPHQCHFCCNDGLQKLYKAHGFYPRQRSVEKFIAEFKDKQKKYGLQYLFVMSENFFQGEGRFKKFIELYKGIKIPFWVETRPETVTEERLRKLKEVGCEGISMGIEHGNDKFRREVLNRFVSNDAVVKGFQTALKSGLRVTANSIVGYPEETRELFFDTVEVNRKIQGAYTMINIFSPHRGTILWELAVEKGYIPKEAIAGDYRLDSGIDMPHLSKEAIKGLQRTFRLYVYLPKEMWPEIEKAEKFDEEGNASFERLSKIYREKYNNLSANIESAKKVYVGMCADILHHGHLNIINEARKLGEVTIGLMTDKAVVNYKNLPFLPYDKRKLILENIVGVKEVIAQETLDQVPNIKKLRPDFVVHGNDWRTGVQKEVRERVINTLKEWGGKLIEPEYTKGVSSSQISKSLCEIGTTPEMRMKRLKRLLQAKPLIRIMEVHNGLTGLIVENTKVEKNGMAREFDGMWISSLTDSTAKGRPDIEFVDLTSRLNTIHEISEVTTKPIILDGDTGGIVEHFPFKIRSLERIGVSAIIIEDKTGLKKNSLFGTEVEQTQDSIENFSHKISVGKRAQITDDFMIIARIESLILKKGLDDALKRAKAYIEAGADGIMIHSKEKSPQEIIDFCEEYKKFDLKVPLVAVPSSYSSITEQELIDAGVNVVIYANHMLRSAYPAMANTAESILKHERCHEASEELCMPIKNILTLIPGGE